MTKQKNNGILSWLVTRPMMFAVIAFIATIVAIITGTAITGLTGGRLANSLTTILIIIAYLGAAAWLVRKLPGENLSRRSFVEINNAQMFVTSLAFIISTVAIVSNAQAFMMRLLWMESHSTPSFIALIVTLSIFYLYLGGMFIANLYAKYRRIRAMGVGMWKTLATAPFGFAMLWIPGYLMSDTSTKSATKDNEHGWYTRLTTWIMSNNYRTTAVLVLLITMSGFTFGYPALLLTLGLGAAFAIWTAAVGTDHMRKNIGGAYATTAIVINIIMIVGVITYASIVKSTPQTTVETPNVIQMQQE